MAAAAIGSSSGSVAAPPDDTFDLGTVRARVFCDDDGDGVLGDGERGVSGARVYLDTGVRADADATGRLHFSGVPSGMHLAKLDERTLVGAVATTTRQSFYLAAGQPAQVAFPVRCQATVDLGPTEVVVNADAFRPPGATTRTVRLTGTTSPLRLEADGVALPAPTVELDLAALGAEPVMPGPNLADPLAGLELRPRASADDDVVAWQIVIDVEDVGAPVGAGVPSSVLRPVWVIAGRGAPPERVRWTGVDDAGTPILQDGRRYTARLTVGFASGARAETPPRPFGVAVGAAPPGKPSVVLVVDESEGPLFTPTGAPTSALRERVMVSAADLTGAGSVEVRAHLDRRPGEPVAAQTLERAEAARAILIAAGVPAGVVVARGRGDDEPLYPNARASDRARNRRIEIVIPSTGRVIPPLPLTSTMALMSSVTSGPTTLRVGGVFLPVNDGRVDTTVTLGDDAVLVVDADIDGRRTRLVPADGRRARGAPVDLPIEVDLDEGRVAVDGVGVPLGILGLAVELVPGEPPAVTLGRVGVLRGRTTTVRVFRDDVTAPAVLPDGTPPGALLGEVVVEGAPATIPLPVLPGPGTAVRVRVVVVDDVGNVGIAPDLRFVTGGPPKETLLSDPAVDDALTPTTREALARLASGLPPGATVRVEAHSDNDGPRLNRMGRTQRIADAARDVLVGAGVAAERIVAVGRGSDLPVRPNTSARNRRENRRLVIEVTSPGATAPTSPLPPAELRVNGEVVALDGGRFVGSATPLERGEVTLALRDGRGGRATWRVRRERAPPWQGTPAAFMAAFPPTSDTTGSTTTTTTIPTPLTTTTPAAGSVAGDVSVADRAPWPGEGAPPTWWPTLTRVPAAGLVVELPPEGTLSHHLVPVRGRAAPDSVVTVNGAPTRVDPVSGRFETRVSLADGPGQILVEAEDSLGNVARFSRPVQVDTSGWFALLLADTAVGDDNALLDERSATTSLTLGPAFVYGRGAAYVKGRFTGPTLFRDYDLTLHLDTRRFDDDVFFRDVLDPDRFMPAWGDSAFEVQEARSGIPLFVELKADASSLSVGSVHTDVVGGDLLRYRRARTGARLTFDRGWLDPVDVSQRTSPSDPATDPWRTQATTFAVGGGGERHARVELMGTGGSVYFLRHNRLVEGSERLAVIVRDGITGAEIARTHKQRNVDYVIRYDEGRVLMKEPVQAFADGAFIMNHNLGQVAAGHRVFVEVEYEHRDDRRLQGIAGGGDVSQRLFGLVDIGGSFVAESRDDGGLGYQVGGVRARVGKDGGTYLKAELLGSQSVDAGNFVSFDGGLTHASLGQSLDTPSALVGGSLYPASRSGAAFKVDGAWRFGDLIGRPADDGVARGYVQAIQPGFFGGGSGIVEQGQTKWGGEVGWRLSIRDEVRLRYDGVIADINPFEPVVAPRTLHRQLGTGRYARTLVPGLRLAGEVGYGYTADSGSFGAPVDDGDPARATDFHTVITAAGLDWKATDALALSLKQEVIAFGDPRQLTAWNDHFVTHGIARYALTDDLSVDGGASVRWSGEHQVHAGIGYRLSESSRVYVSERVGMLPAPGTGTMGFSNTTVVGSETELATGSTAYAEYQLQSAFSSEQTRGVVGLRNRWALPLGLAVSMNYERIATLGAANIPLNEDLTVAPTAFTDGTFYAAPGQNGAGSFLMGDGTRDAASAGLEWRRDDLFMITQRLELRYDDYARGAGDTAWVLSMTAMALKVSPELSLLARYNLALAHDVALGRRVAYLEEGSVGGAFRPVGHDWLSVLAKFSRRVDVRPIGLDDGGTDTAIHAFAVEPIVELPWGVQLVEKVAIKHLGISRVEEARQEALTALWINRATLRTLALLRRTGLAPGVPGELDVGVEYRVLSGLSWAGLEHGALVEVQVAPWEQLRLGVGYNFTRFSDNETEQSELEGGVIDRSGFFVRAVGAW